MSEQPDWWRWDGGWREVNGMQTRYYMWDELDEDSVVFEVGAHEGKWVRRMAEKYACHIHAFEPAPSAYRKAKRAIGAASKVYLYNVALWTENGKRILGDCDRDGASLIKDDKPSANVETKDVDEFIRKKNITHIDLMSINIEGGEFYLIPYMIEKGIVPIVDRFMIQWHLNLSPEGTRENQIKICDEIAKTHDMIWNHGAWEAWEIR